MVRVAVINANLEEEMTADFNVLWPVMPEGKKRDFAKLAMEASVLNQQYLEREDGIAGFRAADLRLSFQRLRHEKKV